jgi:hypothetical protein
MHGEIGCRREQMVLGGLVPHPHQGDCREAAVLHDLKWRCLSPSTHRR